MEISSHVISSNVPSALDALWMGRGGASLTAEHSATDAITLLSGGASKAAAASSTSSILGIIDITPQGKACVFMAIAMALHYLGYSLARPITISMFTSAQTGYAGKKFAFPLAMGFVSPMALILLFWYGHVLEKKGPRDALIQSTLLCSLLISAAALAIRILTQTNVMIHSIPAVKFITGPLFVFREAYVQLLTSQYWSFMASALTPSQSARWFAPIAGLTSIASAVAGVLVSPLVEKIGLSGGLLGTGLMLLCSIVGASAAYHIAGEYGFTPTANKDIIKATTHKKHKKPKKPKGKIGNEIAKEEERLKMRLLEKAMHLFARVPVLWALFLEILASQGLATVLNVCFVSRLESAIPNDAERAGWVGKFYSLINVITMVLQFVVLPKLMTVMEPRDLWRLVPLVTLLVVAYQSLQADPSLTVVSASLLVMKVSEYSARRMLDEMVFVPLDFESRYLGKEVLGVFAYRFGKSLMSLGLSGITALFGNFDLQQLSLLSSGVALVWLQTAWKLSNLVPTRIEADLVYKEQHRTNSAKKKKRR